MKRILCIVLCATILSGVLVFAKLGISPYLMKDANYGMARLKTMGKVDILFVGSSMFRQGIDTQSLSDGQEQTYLLAYNGNQPFSIYLEIEELLDNGVQIDYLVVDMYAYSLTADVMLSDVRIFQDNSTKFTYSLYETMRENGSADVSDLHEMLIKTNNEVFFTWPISFPLINDRYINGSNASKNKGATADQLSKLPLDFGNTEINDVQAKALDNLIQLCREKNVDIMFLETPKYSYLYQGDAYCNIMGEYIKLLNSYGCKQIISQRTAMECGVQEDEVHTVYSFESDTSEFFTDLLHMSSDGREAFSVILKQIMGS